MTKMMDKPDGWVKKDRSDDKKKKRMPQNSLQNSIQKIGDGEDNIGAMFEAPISKKLKKINRRSQDYDVDDILKWRTNKLSHLSVIHMRFIEYFSLGYSILKSASLTNMRNFHDEKMSDHELQQKCRKILASEAGKAYLKLLNEQYRDEHYITRDQVIKELADRFHNATDKDAVKIATVLSKMEGWNNEVDIKPQINITWGSDPFVDARGTKTLESGCEGLLGEGDIEAEFEEVKEFPLNEDDNAEEK